MLIAKRCRIRSRCVRALERLLLSLLVCFAVFAFSRSHAATVISPPRVEDRRHAEDRSGSGGWFRRRRGSGFPSRARETREIGVPTRPYTGSWATSRQAFERASAAVEAVLETFISFRISGSFSFRALQTLIQTLLTDLGLSGHGACGCGHDSSSSNAHLNFRSARFALRLSFSFASRTSLGESGIHRSFASHRRSVSVGARLDSTFPSAFSAHFAFDALFVACLIRVKVRLRNHTTTHASRRTAHGWSVEAFQGR